MLDKSPIVEKRDLELPSFLVDMKVDHTEEADAIGGRVGDWKNMVDEEQGIKGLGELLLNNMTYMSREQEDAFGLSVKEEIVNYLEGDPTKKIIFVVYIKNRGSGKYFTEKMIDVINPELRDRVSMWSWVDFHHKSVKDPENTDFYILDDSSNSGQQVLDLVRETVVGPISRAVDNLRSLVRGEVYSGTKVKLKLRLMVLTDKAKKDVEDFLEKKGLDLSPFFELDLYGNDLANSRMTTVEDILSQNGIEESDLQKPYLLLESHMGRRPTTTKIFFHKVQDNMPLCMVRGGMSHLTNVQPLIDQDEIDSIGKLYTHRSDMLI